MMSLGEAIQHCLEVAEMNQSIADNTEHDNWMDIAQCEKCAEDHQQLAKWLRELKERREQPEIIRCKDCKHWINDHLCESLSKFGSFETKADFYCGYAERRTDGTD